MKEPFALLNGYSCVSIFPYEILFSSFTGHKNLVYAAAGKSREQLFYKIKLLRSVIGNYIEQVQRQLSQKGESEILIGETKRTY